MVPGTWLSIVFFVLLVAPGLLFDLLSERRRAGVPESTFREISRVVLASLFFSVLSLGILLLIRVVFPSILPDPAQLLVPGSEYLAQHYGLIFGAVVAEAAIALGAAGVTHELLARRRDGKSLRAVSTWRKTLRDDTPSGTVPHVRVRMADGTMYLGRVGHYTADLEVADRELVLVPPLFVKPPGDKPLAEVPSEQQRLIITGNAVEAIFVQYRPNTTG